MSDIYDQHKAAFARVGYTGSLRGEYLFRGKSIPSIKRQIEAAL